MNRITRLKQQGLLFVILVLALPSSNALALDVSVTGLRNSEGDVVVCVWKSKDNGFPDCGNGQPYKKQHRHSPAIDNGHADTA